jgi:hypothetical protein
MIRCPNGSSEKFETRKDRRKACSIPVGVFICQKCGTEFVCCPYCGQYPDGTNSWEENLTTTEVLIICNHKDCMKKYYIAHL